MKLILLPGLDGTGQLFSALIEQIGASIPYEVICLNDYDEENLPTLVNKIAAKLPQDELILFAESYSGRIAYELCLLPNLNIQHVIFVASFLARPSLISRLAPFLPLTIIRSDFFPSVIFEVLFFGATSQHHLVRLFRSVIKNVSNTQLKRRLKNIATLSAPKQIIRLNCTCLQASHDYLVGRNAIKDFKKLCPRLELKEITGGHFLAQSNPEECFKTIQSVARSLKY